ncbi:MAG TPA: tetratricopeptide repeat protein [Pyrinomonadaceae bacterium]|nr:tetratricopeptide repeat protein [Pyrinomonadaceae bacterium]
MRIRLPILSLLLILTASSYAVCQGGRGAAASNSRHIVYGDIKVDQGQAGIDKPILLDLTLFNEYGNAISRQRVQSNGRYRFLDLQDGRYYIVIEYEGAELDRFTVDFSSQYKSDLQKDIELQARAVSEAAKAAVVVAADRYDRSSKTSSTFSKAKDAAKNKKYDEAAMLLRQVVETDPADFPAWLELGTAYFNQKNYAEAEKAYMQAISKHPDYALALINLGRLRIVQKNYDGAIEVLSQAVKIQPPSAQANYFLGEAYLQNKKGSLGVGYLNEAIKLDPVGMADAHLRLAALYNAVGMKDKAAAEYEEFLKKVPNHPDAKKLKEYIEANKPKN